MSRVAIVIGVNKPKSPGALKGAVSDAKAFADWIQKQGFEIATPFIDDQNPVTFANIFAEVQRIVDARTYSQAVIYFAGHGLQGGGSEIWLLSGAPDNPGEAISLEASVMAARESGLANVVFISDACRSIPNGLQSSRLVGNSIFPIMQANEVRRPKVDRLFATLPSKIAVEASKADDKARREGIFTRELMRSYRNPPAELIGTVQDGGTTIEVITNRNLDGYVQRLVEDAAFAVAPQSGQLPDFILESVDAYVGRVESTEGAVVFSRGGSGPSPPTLAAVAQSVVEATRVGNVRAVAALARQVDQGLGLEDSINLFGGAVPVERFETQTGFSVTGARVKSAACQSFRAEQVADEFVRLWPDDPQAPSASVLIEFDNGNGVVLPALRRYIGHIFVEGAVVSNVNYVPATNSDLWLDYTYQRREVEALRAAVAATARLGVFRVDRKDAEKFANRIRDLKAYDPTLGLYAAYAYASADLERDAASVSRYMQRDLRAELFDVVMLAERGASPREIGPQLILPFCPMLRQGWSLLAVREAQLSDAVKRAQDFLLSALWTTFAPEGVHILRQAIENGDFR